MLPRCGRGSGFTEKMYTSVGCQEFSSYCRCNCYYCGLRSGNGKAQRYRLTKEEILACCREGYALGFRTFVLQSGEDRFFTASRLADIVEAIRSNYPDCAVTLSVGERKREDYALWKKAGAERYLLRHETACPAHYGSCTLLLRPCKRVSTACGT